MITGSLNRCLLIIGFIYSLNLVAQEMPPTLPHNPSEVIVPFDQLIYVPDPIYPTVRKYVWPSLENKLLELMYSEPASVHSVLPTINLGGDTSFGYGSGMVLEARKSSQVNLSFSYVVPEFLLNGDPNPTFDRTRLECRTGSEELRYVYSGETVSFSSPLTVPAPGEKRFADWVQCNQYYGMFGRVTLNRISYVPLATKPDLSIGVPVFPDAKIDENDGLPILVLNELAKVNVPISMSSPNNVTPDQHAKSIFVKVNIGTEVYSKIISVADLANAGSLLVPFEIKPQNIEVGIARVFASVDSEGVFFDEIFANNLNFKDVHIVSVDDLNLQISSLSLFGSDPCNINGPIDLKKCQFGKIKDGDVLNVPFGAVLKLALISSENENIPALFELVEDTIAFEGEIEPSSLFPNQLAVLFNQSSDKASQSLITAHLGVQQVKITPLDSEIAPLTITLNSKSSEVIGSANNSFDDLIISRAHKIGVPPQFIKGQVEKESGSKFNASAYRYEPVTVDSALIQPKITSTPSKYGFSDSEVTASRRYSKFLFRRTDRLINDSILINLRSQYEIVYQKKIQPIPLDYESTAKLNQYTPVGIGDIFYANPVENWPLLDPEFNQKVAQTALASSYGLMQILYTTAVEKTKFVERGNKPAGKNPLLLLDPETNLELATNYLVNCIKVVNSRQTVSIDPNSNVSSFKTFIELGFAGYNLGPNHKFSKQIDFNKVYRDSVINNIIKYQIYLKDEIL